MLPFLPNSQRWLHDNYCFSWSQIIWLTFSCKKLATKFSTTRETPYDVSVPDLCIISMISTMWRSIGLPGCRIAKTASTTTFLNHKTYKVIAWVDYTKLHEVTTQLYIGLTDEQRSSEVILLVWTYFTYMTNKMS